MAATQTNNLIQALVMDDGEGNWRAKPFSSPDIQLFMDYRLNVFLCSAGRIPGSYRDPASK